MQLDKDGFWMPKITDKDACINCGICLRCCAFADDKLANDSHPINAYAGWSSEASVRSACSSGGVAFEISRYLIKDGYKVCAVSYNCQEDRAEHYIATDAESLVKSVGSKYIPSYTYDAFSLIDINAKHLIIGTPCQVDSFRRYVRLKRKEENFVFVDFFCHGVPSMNVWRRYVTEAKRKIGNIEFVSWRNKCDGWTNSWSMSLDSKRFEGDISMLEEKRENSAIVSMRSDGNPFYYMFLSNSCLNKACFKKCKYKYDKSAADIRIGDLWGRTYADNREGVSAVVAFTERGQDVLEGCDCVLHPHDFAVVAEGQMKNQPKMPVTYYMLKWLMRIPRLSLATMRKVMIKEETIEYIIKRLIRGRK